jgi:hypothetical protein
VPVAGSLQCHPLAMNVPIHAAGPSVRGPRVPVRIIAGLAAGLGAAFMAFSVALMANQDSLPAAGWYAGAIAVPVALCAVAAATGRIRVLTSVAAVLFGGLAILGILSIGLLLAPAALCAAVAAAGAPIRTRAAPDDPETRRQEHSS